MKDLIKDPTLELSETSMERVVESVWVATLAGTFHLQQKLLLINLTLSYSGDIAQTSLLRTPKKMESFGPRGQWNCSLCPREYKLATREHSMLTTAEFYGGIDGNI